MTKRMYDRDHALVGIFYLPTSCGGLRRGHYRIYRSATEGLSASVGSFRIGLNARMLKSFRPARRREINWEKEAKRFRQFVLRRIALEEILLGSND